MKLESRVAVATDDAMEGHAWFRLHAQLVSSGIWASLKPCSRTVLVVLASLLNNKRRITYAGVQRVADLAGLSVHRTMFAYKELRVRGLIWRRRVRVGPFWPYETGLTNPHRWCSTSVGDGCVPPENEAQ